MCLYYCPRLNCCQIKNLPPLRENDRDLLNEGHGEYKTDCLCGQLVVNSIDFYMCADCSRAKGLTYFQPICQRIIEFYYNILNPPFCFNI